MTQLVPNPNWREKFNIPNNFGKDPLGVREFYKDKTILITGCTGYVGKIILEKLIRCTEFKRIYVMIRNRAGSTLQ